MADGSQSQRRSAELRRREQQREELLQRIESAIGSSRGDRYASHRERQRRRQAAISRSGRNVGPFGEVRCPERKEEARRSLRRFCECYFPRACYWPFSADHLKVLEKIERCMVEGGQFALAMPRGSGKSTLCELAAIWAVLYGLRKFVLLIGADEGAALTALEAVKRELENNELLAEDWPAEIGCIRALEGISQRARAQLYEDRPTHVEWREDRVVLPSLPDSPASGAVIRARGLLGSLRGMRHKRPDGEVVRPDVVLIDDPQTDESAHSPAQCQARERLIERAVMTLGGPNVRVAALMPCTVIAPGDLADRMLNRELHPEWQGEKMRLLHKPPAAESDALWERYAELLREDLAAGRGTARATQFYAEHREQMDRGAEVAWPERREPWQISAVQHAMTIKLLTPDVFAAEYQNEPLKEDDEAALRVPAEEIVQRCNGLPRGTAPAWATHLTAFVDVQEKLLWFLVAAWGPDFSGAVLEYGAYPGQKRRYYTLRDAKMTLRRKFPGRGLDGALRAGLDALAEELLGREWKREDGTTARISRCLVDAAWGATTDLVMEFCRRSPHAAVLTPSFGRSVRASHKPISEWQRRPGDVIGLEWRYGPAPRRRIRHVVYDANWWKSFVHARLGTPVGQAGALTLYGTEPAQHRMLADHLAAEKPTRCSAAGRVVDEWALPPNRPDNHLLDCLVGAAVAASMCGVRPPGSAAPTRRSSRRRRRVSYLEP